MFLYLHLRYGVGLWMQVANQKEFVHKGEMKKFTKKGDSTNFINLIPNKTTSLKSEQSIKA